jgi:hypothetical protein
MKSAALQIPTTGSAGCVPLKLPEMEETLLHQILLKLRVSCEPSHDLPQQGEHLGLFN